jgi:hypothetical protein
VFLDFSIPCILMKSTNMFYPKTNPVSSITSEKWSRGELVCDPI